MKNLVTRFFKEEEGQALTEYGLIIGLIAVVVIAALVMLGGQLKTLFTNITGVLSSNTPAA